MCHTALMLLIFISFCVLNSILSYDQSKRAIEVGAFDRRWAFCGEPEFSFNHDRHSTSRFKIFSSSQKGNCLFLGVLAQKPERRYRLRGGLVLSSFCFYALDVRIAIVTKRNIRRIEMN
jgi:hypothetical protein